MGGGGAMRAAAKVASIGAITGGFRPVSDFPAGFSAVRNAVRPVSATVCGEHAAVGGGGMKVEQAAVQRPAWEIDDWDMVGGVEEESFVVDRVEPGKTRFVFGGPVPSFEETMEATCQLRDALDQVYLSSPRSSTSVESVSSHDTKACVTAESSVPKGAMQAFKLLKESPAAQTVVASIACDPNVWSAVMQNPSLVEFLQSDKRNFDSETQEIPKVTVDFDDAGESGKPDGLLSFFEGDAEESGKPDGLMSFFERVKVTVVDMVNSLTNFVENLFAAPDVKEKSESSQDTSSKTSFAGGSIMALAMMVIMVVLMKRG